MSDTRGAGRLAGPDPERGHGEVAGEIGADTPVGNPGADPGGGSDDLGLLGVDEDYDGLRDSSVYEPSRAPFVRRMVLLAVLVGLIALAVVFRGELAVLVGEAGDAISELVSD